MEKSDVGLQAFGHGFDQYKRVFSVLIRLNSISCVAIHILRNACCVFRHSVKPTRQKTTLRREPYRRLPLFPKHLSVGLAIGIEAVMFTAFPCGFQLANVPVRTAFL